MTELLASVQAHLDALDGAKVAGVIVLTFVAICLLAAIPSILMCCSRQEQEQ